MTTLGDILIVDDYEDGREMYAEFLAFSGFRVWSAASGKEAISAIRAECPTLMLMDIGMQGMTGTEAMRHSATRTGRTP
jgi:two-component system, cell cycle response regulator DivK